MTGVSNEKVEVKIVIFNKAERVDLTSFKHLYIYDTHTVSLTDRSAVSQGATHSIQKGGRYTVKVVITPTDCSKHKIPVLFTFRRSGEEYGIVREILYDCVPDVELFKEAQPVRPYEKPKVIKPEPLEIVRSNVKATIDNRMQLEREISLGQYRLEAKVRDQLEYMEKALTSNEAEERWSEVQEELGLNRFNKRSYTTFFTGLLHVEENQQEVDIAQYAMEEVQLTKDKRSNYIIIKIPGLAENRPSVLKGDALYVTKTPPDGKKYEGVVQQVELDSVKVEFDSKLTDKFIDRMKFGVQFTINRFSLRLEHRAISKPMFQKVSSVLFPSPQRQQPLASRFRFFNGKVESNAEQNAAVKHILSGTSMEAPYLIYGPPGTGKTSTLVEAIKQVWNSKPGCRILVCAPQNAAADLLTERLLAHVDEKDILRLNAPSRSFDDIHSLKVRKVSNYVEDSSGGSRAGGGRLFGPVAVSSKMKVEFPSRDVLKQRKILVSTLVTSGRLVSANMRNHFTHIFIDEAGHATEPETVIPLSGLVGGSSVVQVVLAGDPKQLGPVVRSSAASELGKSLLERLMSSELHRQDPISGSFNPDYVTKLVRSFRSHPDILEVPNACFYDNELIAQADKMQRERFCDWEGLPTKGFPLIFHGMNSDDCREGKSPSWFNPGEVSAVVNYVKLLMDCKRPRVTASDIGIISPYHQQVNKILKGLKALEMKTRERTRNYDKIDVGSVEKFQGSEKEIIIISTVRSQDAFVTADKKFNLGFIYNPKRFNVAVTRAKALLIIVGNPSILRRSKDWLRLMNHIEEGGGYVGVPPPDEVDNEELTEVTDMMKAMDIKEALANGVSEYQQQGNQEWRRKE
ncbi:putative helicase mov-10-B.1 [Watersipora subatra]|uniref:putative helicase mov-10-B.1 n=1 Tax=Watersipora subatra TaxID=2589382 RepID=UPI00355B9488